MSPWKNDTHLAAEKLGTLFKIKALSFCSLTVLRAVISEQHVLYCSGLSVFFRILKLSPRFPWTYSNGSMYISVALQLLLIAYVNYKIL